jgi:hypothetical protein
LGELKYKDGYWMRASAIPHGTSRFLWRKGLGLSVYWDEKVDDSLIADLKQIWGIAMGKA